jgi:hypothetical protein
VGYISSKFLDLLENEHESNVANISSELLDLLENEHKLTVKPTVACMFTEEATLNIITHVLQDKSNQASNYNFRNIS